MHSVTLQLQHLTFFSVSNSFSLFLVHGIDFNAQDAIGNTPLHVAVENDSFDAIDFLLAM